MACRSQRISTISAGSQIQCLGLGTWADSPCSGRTDSTYDSNQDLWKLRLDVDGNQCNH